MPINAFPQVMFAGRFTSASPLNRTTSRKPSLEFADLTPRGRLETTDSIDIRQPRSTRSVSPIAKTIQDVFGEDIPELHTRYEEFKDELKRKRNAGGLSIYGAFSQSKEATSTKEKLVVGSAIVHGFGGVEEHPVFGFIYNVGVVSFKRGQGIASRAVEKIKSDFPHTHLFLTVDPKASRSLYSRAGFHPISQEELVPHFKQSLMLKRYNLLQDGSLPDWYHLPPQHS